MATILIVEDDIDTNEAVCEYLQEAGYNTVPAFDGDEIFYNLVGLQQSAVESNTDAAAPYCWFRLYAGLA